MEQGLNSRAVQQKPAHAKKAKAHARLTNAKKMAAHAKARVAPSPIMGQWTKERENKWAEICRENPALIAAIEGASPKDSEDAWKSSSTGADSMAGEANQSWESAFDGQQGARSLPEGISYPGSGDTVSVNIASLIGGDSRSLTLEFERNPDEISVSNSMSVKNCQLRIGKTSFTISAKKKGIFSKRAEIGIVQNDGEGHERSATLSIGKDGSLAGDPDELERIGIKAFRLN
jgi:hypothetical protein